MTLDSLHPQFRFTYPGDDNLLLQEVQRVDETFNISMLMRRVAIVFNLAAEIMDSDERLDKDLLLPSSETQIIFQEIYDLLGTIYRYEHDDAGQHELFVERSKSEDYRANWQDWYLQQLQLLSNKASFVRLGALLLRNKAPTQSPNAPEQSLVHMIYRQFVYGDMTISRRNRFTD